MSVPRDIADKLETLTRLLREGEPCLVAVSGGLDSRFLAAMARRSAPAAAAVFFSGPHLTPGERDWARQWLAQWGGPWRELAFDPLELQAVRAGDRLRCYHCKAAAFSQALALAGQLGAGVVVEGSNRSDREAWRPGMQALAELGVQSPLDAAGLRKEEIRAAARILGLERWDQPARPCLLTRLPYGLSPRPELLAELGWAEDAMARLGLGDFRVRLKAGGGCAVQLGPGERGSWESARVRCLELLVLAGLGPVEEQWPDEVSGYFDRAGQ